MIGRISAGSGVRGEPCIDRATAESSLEALLRRTEALQLSSMEADRARLIAVAERLVQLGAAVGARDAEGRTALHLAAGCGDKAMVLKLVALGTDINCRDSVGGAPPAPSPYFAGGCQRPPCILHKQIWMQAVSSSR